MAGGCQVDCHGHPVRPHRWHVARSHAPSELPISWFHCRLPEEAVGSSGGSTQVPDPRQWWGDPSPLPAWAERTPCPPLPGGRRASQRVSQQSVIRLSLSAQPGPALPTWAQPSTGSSLLQGGGMRQNKVLLCGGPSGRAERAHSPPQGTEPRDVLGVPVPGACR